jgi:hypothetical protein
LAARRIRPSVRLRNNKKIIIMKTKLSLLSAVLIAVTIVLANLAFAQTYSGKTNTSSTSSKAPASNAAASPGEAKPGTVLSSGVIVGTPITKEDAAKKYPAPRGGYPAGERNPHMASGLVKSPYAPHKEFDCSKIGHGELVLDTYSNHVFVRP